MLERESITGVSKGIHNRHFHHFFLIIVAFVVLAGFGITPATAGQDVPKAHSALIAKAQAEGSVRIIVKLDRSSRPEGLLAGSQAVNEQRARISGLQNQLHRAVSRYHVRGIKKFRHIPFQAMEVDVAALTSLIDNPLVVSIEEDVPVRPSLTESIPLIQADQAWGSGYSGAGWTVAILDTGVDKSHSMFAGKVVAEACFSTTNAEAKTLCPNGRDSQIGSGAGVNCSLGHCYHGTHVAGIAAGKSDAVNGVAKDASIISIQVFSNFDGDALSYASDQIQALEHVYSLRNTYKIAAVNMSLGSGRYTSYCNSDSRKAAIDNLRSAGIATVISSGNGDKDNNGYSDAISCPACISSAISVGATDQNDAEAYYSNSHPSLLSLFAPGSSIYSAVPGDAWSNLSGTSMAAPHVTGAWAILKQKSPSASVDDILSNLQSTGAAVTARGGSLFSGKAKRVDILAALNLIDALIAPTELAAAAPENVSGSASSGNEVTLTWIDNSEGETGFRIERKTGANGTYALIYTAAADVTSYVDSGLSGGKTYYYRVSAFKSANDIPLNSDYSNEASATIYTAEVDTPSPAVAAGGGGGGGGGCFIATAAFGTPMEKHVSILRHFRDSILLKTSAGRAFVRFYYDVSPLIAGKIAQNEDWRFITRCSLMPFVGMAYLMVSYGAVATLLFVLSFILMTYALVVVIRRRIAVFNR